jgi:hypothetical protein
MIGNTGLPPTAFGLVNVSAPVSRSFNDWFDDDLIELVAHRLAPEVTFGGYPTPSQQ